MNTDASKVLNFLVAAENGSEDCPVRLGNVDFWHPIPGLGGALCFSLPTSAWDQETVQHDINRLAAGHWESLCAHLKGEGCPALRVFKVATPAGYRKQRRTESICAASKDAAVALAAWRFGAGQWGISQ